MTEYKLVPHEPDHIPDAGKMVADQLRGGTKKIGRPQIREVFMRNGFTIAPDRDDLEDRVYEAAFELLEAAANHIPDAGKMVGEPTPDMISAGVAFALGTQLSSSYRWPDYVRDMYLCMQGFAPAQAYFDREIEPLDDAMQGDKP